MDGSFDELLRTQPPLIVSQKDDPRTKATVAKEREPQSAALPSVLTPPVTPKTNRPKTPDRTPQTSLLQQMPLAFPPSVNQKMPPTSPPRVGQQPYQSSTKTNAVTVNPNAQPLKVQDCLDQMTIFVEKNKLQPIFGNGEDLREKLLAQAKFASQLPLKLDFVNRELVMHLAVLSLYDLAVLIDDSVSMEFEQGGKRKDATKAVLYLLARLYSAVSNDDRGLKLRFLNGNDDLSADDITTPDQIDAVINKHQFNGVTCIAGGLIRKILKPLVYSDKPVARGNPRPLRKMERPLLVMVITDGAVEGEPRDYVERSIRAVVKSLEASGIGSKGVVFQFARVGDDPDAAKFLQDLDDSSSCAGNVDTLSGNDLMGLVDTVNSKTCSTHEQRTLIKMLLGPISEGYDNLEENEEENLDDLDDFLD